MCVYARTKKFFGSPGQPDFDPPADWCWIPWKKTLQDRIQCSSQGKSDDKGPQLNEFNF